MKQYTPLLFYPAIFPPSWTLIGLLSTSIIIVIHDEIHLTSRNQAATFWIKHGILPFYWCANFKTI